MYVAAADLVNVLEVAAEVVAPNNPSEVLPVFLVQKRA